MSKQLLQRIRNMDDFHCVRFLTHVSTLLFDGLDTEQQQLLEQVPPEIRNMQALSPAFQLPSTAGTKMLDAQDAAVCARNILEALAQHPGFKDMIAQALEDYRDDDMFADVILALGLAASMIIVAATTKLKAKYEDGKITVHVTKEVAPTDMVKDVVGHLSTAAGKIPASM